jgi:hypothetical protein
LACPERAICSPPAERLVGGASHANRRRNPALHHALTDKLMTGYPFK